MTDFFNENLTSLHKKLVDKEISATELTKEALNKSKSSQSEINAFITIDDEGALKRAAEIDAVGIDPRI